MTAEIIYEKLEIIIAIGALAGAFAGSMFIGIKKVILKSAEELKNHSDATMRKFNGSMTYAMARMPWPMYIVLVKQESGRVAFRMQELNENYARIYGSKRKDWIGKTDLGAGMPKHLAEAEYERYVKVWATDESIVYWRDMPDGSKEMYSQIPFADDDGNIIGVMCYAIGDCRKLFLREAKKIGLITPEQKIEYEI